MPSYELSLILRTLAKPDLIASIKRTGEMILDNGGILRKFTSLGNNPLPYRIKSTNGWHRDGNYFLIHFDAPTSAIEKVQDALRRETDVIRPHLLKKETPPSFTCTLQEELQPPAYRKDVQELISEGRKIKKTHYKMNIPGSDINPF